MCFFSPVFLLPSPALTIESLDPPYLVVVHLQDPEALESRQPLQHLDGVVAQVKVLKVSMVRQIPQAIDAVVETYQQVKFGGENINNRPS